MKKTIILFGVCSIIFACSNGEQKENSSDANVAVEQEVVESPAPEAEAVVAVGSEKGEQLISASDCLTCHKVDTKIVGPSYIDVANKYEATAANIEMLAGKIVSGGSGNWGEIPMSPHPAITSDDAKEMVKYILALKSK